MKDLTKLVEECTADLLSIGIQPAEHINWSVNTRAQKRWGHCRKASPGGYEIDIAARLLQDDVVDQAAKNTIVHELLHTAKDCMKHTGKWFQFANRVNARLPQYTIKRTTTDEEKGVEPTEAKYIISCPKCGRQWPRMRMSSIVQAPQNYRCGKCGVALRRTK